MSFTSRLSDITIIFYNADWKWVQHHPTCIQRSRNQLRAMGRKFGSWVEHRCPLDYVQTERCSWSHCKSISSLTNKNLFINAWRDENLGVYYCMTKNPSSSCRSIHATEDIVEILSLDRTNPTSLHYGLRTGRHSKYLTVYQFWMATLWKIKDKEE